MLVFIWFVILISIALISAKIDYKTYFYLSAIGLILSTIILIGTFNMWTLSIIIGEIAWLRFISVKHEFRYMLEYVGEMFIQTTLPFFATYVSLLVFAYIFVANSTAIQLVRDFFLL